LEQCVVRIFHSGAGLELNALIARIFFARAGRAGYGTDKGSAPFLRLGAGFGERATCVRSQEAPPHRRRAGFTLVEVIVVLVILAILAAMAVPALMGYIDKAHYGSYKAEARQYATAAQTLISEYWRNGVVATANSLGSEGNGLTYYAGDVLYRNDAGDLIFIGAHKLGDTGTYWNSTTSQLILFTRGNSTINNNGQYTPSTVNCGYSELDRLTGVPARNGVGPSTINWNRFEAVINNSGVTLCWRYKVSSTGVGHGDGLGEAIYVTKDCTVDINAHPVYKANNGLKIYTRYDSAGKEIG
jgi:prepilin-type N-terminal cleavage/methylation domain-containing protein